MLIKRKMTMPFQRLEKLYTSDKVVIFDLRSRFDYTTKRVKGSWYTEKINIEEKMSKYNQNENFVIISKGVRTNMLLIKELRKKGFKRTYAAPNTIEEWPLKKMIYTKKQK